MKKLDKNISEDILSLTPFQEGMLFHYLAGCVYMPIHPGYPLKRINYMSVDSRAGLVITDNAIAEKGEIFSRLKGEKKSASIGAGAELPLYSFSLMLMKRDRNRNGARQISFTIKNG